MMEEEWELDGFRGRLKQMRPNWPTWRQWHKLEKKNKMKMKRADLMRRRNLYGELMGDLLLLFQVVWFAQCQNGAEYLCAECQ
jgi:hypothetical protein